MNKATTKPIFIRTEGQSIKEVTARVRAILEHDPKAEIRLPAQVANRVNAELARQRGRSVEAPPPVPADQRRKDRNQRRRARAAAAARLRELNQGGR
jgi:hypothetical protein